MYVLLGVKVVSHLTNILNVHMKGSDTLHLHYVKEYNRHTIGSQAAVEIAQFVKQFKLYVYALEYQSTAERQVVKNQVDAPV